MLIVGNFLDCGKVTFLTVEKIIGLIILKTNTNNEIIKTHILDLEQKLSSVVFLCYMKSILYSVEDLNLKCVTTAKGYSHLMKFTVRSYNLLKYL